MRVSAGVSETVLPDSFVLSVLGENDDLRWPHRDGELTWLAGNSALTVRRGRRAVIGLNG